jgi:hypothetical protein
VIYICVRQTTDWTDEAGFWAQLPPQFRPTVEIWNATFKTPYHLFRHRLREIARMNLARVRNAVCADWDDVPQGALVLPVDDDDWFAEDVVLAVEKAAAPAFGGYRWESTFLEVPINLGHRLYLLKRRLLHTPPKWICTTNNYAIVKTPESQTLFTSHIRASEWFHRHAAQVKTLDGRWSIMNRSLASRTSLGIVHPETCRPIRTGTLLRKYRQYKELYRRPPGSELQWCRPYVRMMDDLMRELQR